MGLYEELIRHTGLPTELITEQLDKIHEGDKGNLTLQEIRDLITLYLQETMIEVQDKSFEIIET